MTSCDAFVQGSLGGQGLQIDLGSQMQSELMKLGVIYWTSDDCDGQVDLKLHLSVGQVILFPYFDHCNVHITISFFKADIHQIH